MDMERNNIKKRVVGVDIGTLRTNYAIIDVRGKLIAQNSFSTKNYPEVDRYVDKLTEAIVEIAEANGGLMTIRSVGISCPSAVYLSGCIENSPNLPWKGIVPLAAMMRDRLGLAVALGNDAHNSALGEKMYGSAHGMKNFIVVNIGVGLGSCFFSEGHEHQGAQGYAGEIGHTCIEENGRLCACGLKGCLEAYVASAGIVQTARELLAESDAPSKMRDIGHLDSEIIAHLCDEGDELAIEVYRRTGHIFGRGLATYASLVNPEAIIITGGVSHAGHWLMDPTQESFEKHVFGNMRGKVHVMLSDLDDAERDVLGAGALAWEVPEYSLFK
jgi:glucokinase